MLVAAVLAPAACGADNGLPEVVDPRACGHSTVALNEATKTFELVVPAETTGLRFSSSTGGMGGVGLTLTARSLAVDHSDPAAPRVLVVASTL